MLLRKVRKSDLCFGGRRELLRLERGKKNERPQIVGDYMATLFRISNNDRFHVPVRVAKLNAWAAKFRTGFPRKNNQEFATKWAPYLQNAAEALANQLIQIEKAKTGDALQATLEGLRAVVANINAPTEVIRGPDGKAIGTRKVIS